MDSFWLIIILVQVALVIIAMVIAWLFKRYSRKLANIQSANNIHPNNEVGFLEPLTYFFLLLLLKHL